MEIADDQYRNGSRRRRQDGWSDQRPDLSQAGDLRIVFGRACGAGGSVNERSTKATKDRRLFLCVLRLEGPLLAAGSTDRCNTFCELLSWGLIEQGLSRSFIELPC